MQTLIKNGKILLQKNDSFKIAHGSVIVEDQLIKEIILHKKNENTNKTQPANFDKIIDASNSLIMPGLINSHTHAYMSIFKNFADDLEFFDWLHNVGEVEDRMTADECYWTSLLAIIEMIRTGTTCFVDMCVRNSIKGVKSGPEGSVSGAVRDSGMRAFLGRGLVGEASDKEAWRRINEFMTDFKLNDDCDRLKFVLGPHAPYSCPQSLQKEITKIGKENNLMVITHVSESEAEMAEIAANNDGITPVEFMANSGLFDLPTIAAHLVKATDNDIKILKKHNVSAAINPRSNMKLGNGFAPVKKFLDAGLNICLGTDGNGSNNTQNMFQEMQFASLIYKGAEKKAKCIDAEEVIKFATINGAKAVNMEGKIGTIKEGALADIILLDLNVPEFIPENNLISALCYSVNGSEVKTVIINGQIIMEDKKLLTIDEDKVYQECIKIAKRIKITK